MNKALITLAIISSLLLLAVGCKSNPSTPAPGAQDILGDTAQPTQPTQQATPVTGAADTGITGSINEVDSLSSELSDPELEKTGDYLNEVDW